MKLKQTLMMPVGMLLLAGAIVMQKFLPHNDLFDFTSGVLIGLSIALNIGYIIAISRKSSK
jgi:hypothetical protein